MKKGLKITLIVIGVLVGFILLDTLQAKLFNNSPIIKLKTIVYSNCHKEHEGIFVTTRIYYDEDKRTRFNWEPHLLYIKVCKEPYEILVEELNKVNNIIVAKLIYQHIEYDNLSYHYIDTNQRIVTVGLENNSEEEQKWFRDNIVDSELLYFEEGNKPIDNLRPNKNEKTFLGKVVEVDSSYIIVEPNEDEEERKSADNFIIDLKNDNTTYKVGTKVKITYDGFIMESYPAQIGTTKIEIIK